MERRKPKNRGKSRKLARRRLYRYLRRKCLVSSVFLLLLTQQLFRCAPSLPRVWSKSRWWLGRELRNRRLSECEFVSGSCCRLCLHSLQLEDMPQFLAMQAFFLCMILAVAGYSRLLTFQVTGWFLCAPKLFRAFWFLPPFWMCFIRHDCYTTSRGSFVKHGFRRVLLNAPAVWMASLIKSVYQNKFLTCLSFGVNGVLV